MSTLSPSEQDQQFPYPSTFSVENLRAFEQKSTVELSRINLVFGANSAGKSTLGKAMLAACRLQNFETMHQLTSLPRRFSSRMLPGRSNRANVIESTIGSSMESLTFAHNQEPITISISTDEYQSAVIGENTKVEFKINPSRKVPIKQIALTLDDMPLATWSESGNSITELGTTMIQEINLNRSKKLDDSVDALGTVGLWNEKPTDQKSGLVLASDILREIIAEGLGVPPRYGLDLDVAGEIRRLRNPSGNINQLIKAMGANVRIANPRAAPDSQLFDEASGLLLGLGEVGSGIGQLISVATRIDRANTDARNLKSFGSCRFPFLLIQEPEAHLHPLKQAEMGEMLCREALKNPMRIVIETHSDALLFRCLKLIRRGELRHDLLRVIFVEQDARGRSTARNLQVGPDGALLDPFPIGFLDWGLEYLIGQ